MTELANVEAPLPAVVLQGLGRRYADVIALDDISLTVPSGTILGVIGPSGRRQDHDGPHADRRAARRRPGSARPRRGPAALPPANPRTDRLHAAAVQPLSGPHRGRERGLRRQPVRDARLPPTPARPGGPRVRRPVGERGRRAAELSGGMQRRLELACALVHDPALLFLDEPTAGIDPLLRRAIWTELHRLRESGRDDPRDHPVRGRGRGVRRRRPHLRGSPRGPGPTGRSAPLRDGGRHARDRDGGRSSMARSCADLPMVRAVEQRVRAPPARHRGRCRHRAAGRRRGHRRGRRRGHLESRVPTVVRRRLRDARGAHRAEVAAGDGERSRGHRGHRGDGRPPR